MLIELAIWVLIFVALAYLAWWLCQKFQAPLPVFWIVGLVLLLILLMHIAQISGVRLP